MTAKKNQLFYDVHAAVEAVAEPMVREEREYTAYERGRADAYAEMARDARDELAAQRPARRLRSVS